MALDQSSSSEHDEFSVSYQEGAVVVVRIRVATVTEDVVAQMVQQIDALREQHADEIRAWGGTRSIHDWRSVQRFPADARRRLSNEWEKLTPLDVRSVEVALSPNPVMHGLAQIMSLVSMRRAGKPIRIIDDIDATLAALR